MSRGNGYKNLSDEQIKTLKGQGCRAQDWGQVKAADGFDASRVWNTQFFGEVNIGSLAGVVKSRGGIKKPSGINNATIIDSTIGDNVRISNVGVHIANYDIGSDVCIENVGVMATRPGAMFGNGIEAAVLNESGGREVILFDELSAQIAYMMCLHRYRPEMIARLTEMISKYVEKVRSDRGRIGAGARIYSTAEIIDVNVGPAAVINGATSLVNGTVLSSEEAMTIVGHNVEAEDFIIAESAAVTGGARLGKVFVGQGSRVGGAFSAENSLFFANCEAFLGEACSIFAGPYTVTHHKATLLIACLFSFYNAGSGTNQSNHMYKLGPVHEGKLDRGAKAGSFSYMMWPCRVGPFSVLLGKHNRSFDTSGFPFSYLDAGADGKCWMVPGLNLATVGTVRDGQKWPNRDRRKGPKRDIISFDIFSPYTVGEMIKASAMLKELQENTDRSIDDVTISGVQMKRVLLRTSQKFYRTGIEMYLFDKILARAEKAAGDGIKEIHGAFAADKEAVYSSEWLDIGGQFMPQQRLLDLTDAVESGKIGDIEAFGDALEKINQQYDKDEWLFIRNAYKEFCGCELEELTAEALAQMADAYGKSRGRFLKQVLADAEKEFGELSQTGFGQDGTAQEVSKDFQQVRGQYEDNKFVKQMQDEVKATEQRVSAFKEKVSRAL